MSYDQVGKRLLRISDCWNAIGSPLWHVCKGLASDDADFRDSEFASIK